jgi:hypothetical protein
MLQWYQVDHLEMQDLQECRVPIQILRLQEMSVGCWWVGGGTKRFTDLPPSTSPAQNVALPITEKPSARTSPYSVAGGTLLLLLLAWSAFTGFRSAPRGQNLSASVLLKQTATVIAFSSATFYYPAIVNSIMAIFTCMQLDRPSTTFAGLSSIAASHRGWWKQDYDMKCFTGGHMVFAMVYGLPFLLLFAIGVPLFITHFLWSYRSRGMLTDSNFQHNFGYMYTDFREGCWFWFCMRFWLLLALSAAIQCLTYWGALRQLITVGLCLSVFLLLQLGFKPYESGLVNNVYTVMLYTVLVTVFLAYVYATPSTVSSHRGTMWAVMVINSVAIAVQLGVILLGLLALRKTIADVAIMAFAAAHKCLRSVMAFCRFWRRSTVVDTVTKDVIAPVTSGASAGAASAM